MCNHSSRYGLACLEMANERFFVDSVVRGFHVYKDVWNPVVGETLICEKEFGNLHDPYAVMLCQLFVEVALLLDTFLAKYHH